MNYEEFSQYCNAANDKDLPTHKELVGMMLCFGMVLQEFEQRIKKLETLTGTPPPNPTIASFQKLD